MKIKRKYHPFFNFNDRVYTYFLINVVTKTGSRIFYFKNVLALNRFIDFVSKKRNFVSYSVRSFKKNAKIKRNVEKVYLYDTPEYFEKHLSGY